jgi:hypothetical protein
MGISLLNQDRHVEAHSMFEKVSERRSRVLGDEHPLTLTSMSCLAKTLYQIDRFDEALVVYETLLPRQLRIHGEGHVHTLLTMRYMTEVLLNLGRVDDAHRTTSRGLIIARKGGNEDAAADFADILSDLEEDLGGGEKDEEKKKSNKPSGGTDRGGARESGGGKVKACAVCMSTVKTKACSGCKQVYYVSWMPFNVNSNVESI